MVATICDVASRSIKIVICQYIAKRSGIGSTMNARMKVQICMMINISISISTNIDISINSVFVNRIHPNLSSSTNTSIKD